MRMHTHTHTQPDVAKYRFDPPDIGSTSTFTAVIPALGAMISGQTRLHLELPKYVKATKDTMCTISHSGIVNSIPYNVYYYPSKDSISEIAVEAAQSVAPTAEILLICENMVVPQTVNDPVTYAINVSKNKEILASTVARFDDMQP
uniref:Phosphoglycerate kinase n=2 Tax=Lygus hesperus TaxID=30085 RepID=A0A0A9XSI7_LYGHE